MVLKRIKEKVDNKINSGLYKLGLYTARATYLPVALLTSAMQAGIKLNEKMGPNWVERTAGSAIYGGMRMMGAKTESNTIGVPNTLRDISESGLWRYIGIPALAISGAAVFGLGVKQISEKIAKRTPRLKETFEAMTYLATIYGAAITEGHPLPNLGESKSALETAIKIGLEPITVAADLATSKNQALAIFSGTLAGMALYKLASLKYPKLTRAKNGYELSKAKKQIKRSESRIRGLEKVLAR